MTILRKLRKGPLYVILYGMAGALFGANWAESGTFSIKVPPPLADWMMVSCITVILVLSGAVILGWEKWDLKRKLKYIMAWLAKI